MKKAIYILLLVFLFSCQNQQTGSENPSSGNSKPKKIPLNTDNGYVMNPATGDSAKAVVFPSGKMVKGGIPVLIEGNLIPEDSLRKPTVVPAKSLAIMGKTDNFFPVTSEIPSIDLDLETLPEYFPGKSNSDFELINSAGNKVKTGEKILVKGKKVKYRPSFPLTAHVPQMKDNSIYSLQFLDVDQKLSSSYLNTIIKDKDENIWMGSWGGGAIRYDGKYFTHFSEKEGLANNHVYSLIQDKKGNIWLGTYGGGLNMFDGNSFYHFTEKEGLGNNYVWAILEDKKGNIWFGTDGAGLVKYDGKHFIHYTQKEGLSSNIIFSLEEDSQGNIWMGTSGGGVNMFNGESFVHIGIEEGLNEPNVWAVFEDDKKNIWFGTGDGVACYDGKKLRQYRERDGLANKYVYAIQQDKNGDLLFGSYGGGLSIFNGKTFENISEESGLTNNFIKAILRDEEGEIWLATDGGGVNKLRRNSFHHYTTKNGLVDNYVNVIFEDSKDNIWFGTYGGVSIYKNGGFSHITLENGLKDNYIRTIMEDSKGNIWLGSDQQGAVKYDGKSFTYYTTEEGLSYNTVYTILEDRNGNIWFATYGGGLTKFDGKNFTHYTEKEGLVEDNIYTLSEDHDGILWIGTWGSGMVAFDGKHFTHYTEKEGMSSNFINSIFENSKNEIWIGTNIGASLFDRKNFIHYTEKEGISNNIVYSTIEDKSGNIWLGSEKNLTRLIPGKNGIPEVNSVFSKEDGLKGIDFCLNSAIIDHQNRAWFGSGKSLEMLDLDDFRISERTPEISFRHLLINENYIDYRNPADTLKDKIRFSDVGKFENYPIKLELPYDHNHLTFHFIAMDWAAPHKIRYQYKLSGLDAKWNPITEHTYADYRNIPYGTYTFQVRAIGESKKWGKTFEYTFTIHPPWWHTTWFRILMISVFGLLLYILFRWRTAALRKRQKQLEKTVKERTAEVVQQKEIVEEKHKEITDSINYAKRLQQAILTSKEEIDKYIPENFLLYKPKDIVAGDFYFFEVTDEYIFYAAADCTGHGVPGAMLSIVCSNALSRSVKEFGLTDPGKILDKTREFILETFEKSKQDVKDGMDISFIAIDRKTKEIKWAGANNPLWYILDGEMKEIKADKQPIGKSDNPKPFTAHTLPQALSALFLFTDGYADQFGGPSGKKFKYANFQKLLLQYSMENLETTNEKLEEVFVQWKNDLEQVDDVCIIGVRI